MKDEDSKKLDQIIHLLQGLALEGKGIRTHVSSVADLYETVLKEVKYLLMEIRHSK